MQDDENSDGEEEGKSAHKKPSNVTSTGNTQLISCVQFLGILVLIS